MRVTLFGLFAMAVDTLLTKAFILRSLDHVAISKAIFNTSIVFAHENGLDQ